ncbi:aminotransferase class V-fold PLP-dependent enzyme [Sneathiella sp. P13V-1]|uniref:cysteine desulfurase family protein n=1 Tax=Sneathiella sp. P13V-1 TaxID=2697366 RepID=UPI00187B4246|nr:cysteine desulfurase family protein [Sneathiella sp. P13V-1]MBE7638165.1 aminotransferase class V-fold PLP-dependent enzyme [Sneathiella sp. P13V-1]
MTQYSADNPLFLDHMSTTPVAPQVQQVMADCLNKPHAPPKSKRLITQAQSSVADLIGAKSDEIIFTSGATEANNLAILGSCSGQTPKTILTTAIEHSSVLAPIRQLEKSGFNIEFLRLNSNGTVDLDALATKLKQPNVALISIQGANNELPIRQPIEHIAQMTKKAGSLFHVDASQSIIGQHLDVSQFPVDMVSLSSQKIYGPQGIGALFVRRNVNLRPLMFGGEQQYGLRPGTMPLFLILGFAKACELAKENALSDKAHLNMLKEEFVTILSKTTNRFALHSGSPNSGNPSLISIHMDGVQAEEILDRLPELTISTGAACEREQGRPSHVLNALGYDAIIAAETLRIGMGRYVTRQDAHYAANMIASLLK